MNRRAQLQLRLQETVQGLSVAALTYYGVGLVAYAPKGIKAAAIALNPDTVAATSIPVLLALVLLGVRKIRKIIARGEATTPSQTVRRSG